MSLLAKLSWKSLHVFGVMHFSVFFLSLDGAEGVDDGGVACVGGGGGFARSEDGGRERCYVVGRL